MSSRISLEVDLSALEYNLKVISQRVSPSGVLAVVKANAYGVGCDAVADTALKCGARMLGVATLTEGLELKAKNLPIQLLSAVMPDEVPEAIANGFGLPVSDLAFARLADAEARKQCRKANVQLIIDTGMGRAGIQLDELSKVIPEIFALPNLNVCGVYTHFSSAGAVQDEYTLNQISAFKKVLSGYPELSDLQYRHSAASDGIVNYPESFCVPFNLVRCGLVMYGMTYGKDELNLRPVLKLSSRIAAIRTLPAGSHVGYMHLYRTERPTRVGLIACGYADGMPLGISNRGRFIVNGRYCPVIGRISMDYITIDITDVPEAQIGDAAVIFGQDGEKFISLAEVAAWNNNHEYQALCALGRRVERHYI